MAGELYISNLVGDFDYQAYLDKLKEIKMLKVNNLKVKEKVIASKIKAVNEISSKIDALLSAVEKLTENSTYQSLKAYSSDSSVASVEVTGNPTLGSYSLNISQLAKANRFLVSPINTVSSPDTTFSGSGSLVINFKEDGETKSIEINYSGKSLKEVAKEINNSGKITATLINVGSETSPDYKLVLSPVKTGLDNVITGINDTGNPGDDSQGVFSESSDKTYETESAQNARFTLNGVEIESNYNELTSTVDGLKLTLKNVGTATITIEKDLSKIKAALKEIIKAYNELHNTIRSLTGKGGPLEGEFSFNAIERTVADELVDKLGKFGILDTIGSAETTKGELTLKEDAVDNLVNSEDFIATLKTVGRTLYSYLDSYNFSLLQRGVTLNEQLLDVQKREKFLTDMINQEIESMRKQFARLQTYLSEMKSLQLRIENFAKLNSNKQNG